MLCAVRSIHIDEVPDDVKLVAGMTATVQIEPYKAPLIADSKPASAKTSQADVQPASFQTLADATSQTAPPDAAKPPATTPAPPVQPANPPATQVAQPQPAVPAASPAAQPTTASAANQLSVSARPSPQAAAAADAAAADLKTSPRADCRQPAQRGQLREERRRNALKRISWANLRPLRKPQRDASEAAVSERDPQARPLKSPFAAEISIALAAMRGRLR